MLLDAYGRPLTAPAKKVLTQELARPGVTSIRNAWAPSVASGLTPERLAGVLTNAVEGDPSEYLAMAEELEERDPHYASVLGTRKRAVSGVEPMVEAASEDARDRKIAEAVEEHIAEHDGFTDLVEDLLDGVGKGFAVVEVMWDTRTSEWTPREFVWRDPRFFRFDRDTQRELRLIDEENVVDGVELAPFKFIRHIPRLKSGLPIRGGLARLIAFTWICKAYTVKDWVAFAELFGLPLRLGRYDGSATKEDIEILFKAVANIGSDAAAVLPKSMEIEFQEIGSGQGHEVFSSLAKWADQQISKAVLGQTMTADDGSSKAQASVHNEVRLDILKADARQVAATINRDLVKPFVALNFGADVEAPVLRLPVEEPEDVKAQVDGVNILARLGVKFSAKELREKLGLGEPEDKDDAVGFDGNLIGGAPQVSANRARAMNAATDPYAELAELEAAAMEDWAEIAEPITDPVERLLREAGSYEEALARLPQLIGEMDPQDLMDRLIRDSAKARGLGDVRD